MSIAFAYVATHNHFVLDRGGKVFKQTAPVIKLPQGATEDEHLALLGVLNSSTACFWLKQSSHNKGAVALPKACKPRVGNLSRVQWHDVAGLSAILRLFRWTGAAAGQPGQELARASPLRSLRRRERSNVGCSGAARRQSRSESEAQMMRCRRSWTGSAIGYTG